MKHGKLLAVTLELFGIAVIGAGVGIELVLHAHYGFFAISVGSCLVAIGGIIWGKFMRKHR